MARISCKVQPSEQPDSSGADTDDEQRAQHSQAAVMCAFEHYKAGGSITVYNGTLDPRHYHKQRKWEDVCQEQQLPACQNVRIDPSGQLLRSKRVSYLTAAASAIICTPGDESDALHSLQVVCAAHTSAQSAADFVFGCNGARPNWQLLYQVMQQWFVLGDASHVDIALWTRTPHSSSSSSEQASNDRGQCSILRVMVNQLDFSSAIFSRVQPLAAHYIQPITDWLSKQTDFPDVGNEPSRATAYSTRTAAKSTTPLTTCSCGGDRVCLNEACGDTCSCRCVASCMHLAKHQHRCDCSKELLVPLLQQQSLQQQQELRDSRTAAGSSSRGARRGSTKQCLGLETICIGSDHGLQ